MQKRSSTQLTAMPSLLQRDGLCSFLIFLRVFWCSPTAHQRSLMNRYCLTELVALSHALIFKKNWMSGARRHIQRSQKTFPLPNLDHSLLGELSVVSGFRNKRFRCMKYSYKLNSLDQIPITIRGPYRLISMKRKNSAVVPPPYFPLPIQHSDLTNSTIVKILK